MGNITNSNIWIGDSRFKAMQFIEIPIVNGKKAVNNEFLTDDFAPYSWFASSGLTLLEGLTAIRSDIIIMPGLQDCIDSCLYSTFKINETADKYAEIVNTLVDDGSSNRIFVCGIGPVNGDFSHALAEDGRISATTLNSKIASFNKRLKISVKAIYIDCYEYLSKSGFTTYDGIRYNHETTECLYDFILTCVNAGTGNLNNFKARLEAPKYPLYEADNPLYWLGESYGGYNPFEKLGQLNARYLGDTMPNCTAYAWGRFYEILGSKPRLSTDKVELWYHNQDDGYLRGSVPKLGAIMCWSGNESAAEDGKGGRGHVAIVEQINDDGSIITSETHFGASFYWRSLKRMKGENNNWGANDAYTFQGFIYNPAVTPGGGAGADVAKSQVTSSNASLAGDKKAVQLNAKYVWQYLGSKGWTLNAVAAVLGNMYEESTINPGRGEIGGSGYGLVQWTPGSKLKNWCDAQDPPLSYDDIDAQLMRIEHERDHSIGKCTSGTDCAHTAFWYRGTDSYGDPYATTYPIMTLDAFSKSLLSPAELACAFLYNYECPGSICWGAKSKEEGAKKTPEEREVTRAATRKRRSDKANEIYNFLAPYAPGFKIETTVVSLTANKVTPTTVDASFLACSCDTGYYEVFNSKGHKIDTDSLTRYLNTGESILKVITFSSRVLQPNEKYTIKVTVKDSENAGSGAVSATTTFKTPQDYPTAVGDIELITVGGTAIPHDSFQLNVDLSDMNFGYWAIKSHGYFMRLFVNGKLKSEKEVVALKHDFYLSEFFGYEAKLGDTVQIGILACTSDYNGNKIYNKANIRMSNPVTMLKKPVTAYLNTNN